MKIPVTEKGIVGLEQIRLAEAASTEFGQVMRLVNEAVMAHWREKLAKPDGEYVGAYCEAIYPDHVIVAYTGRYWRHDYTIDDQNQVRLADAVEVIEQYVPVALRESKASGDAIAVQEASHTFVEAVDEAGTVWDVVVIRAGRSANGNYYPDAVLREAKTLFDGARVFAKADTEHVKGEGKSVEKLVGWLSDVSFVEGRAPDTGRVTARLNISAAEERLRKFLVDAHKRGRKDIVGLSIDAHGTGKMEMREGKKTRVAQAIRKVNSVDIIVEASAGGEFVRLVEAVSQEEKAEMALRDKLIAAIKAHKVVSAKYPEPEKLDEDALESAYREALVPEEKPAARPDPEPKAAPDAPKPVTEEQLRMVEARIAARATIQASGLPAPAVKRLLTQFERSDRFLEADVERAIGEERDYLGSFVESGHVQLPFDSEARVEDRTKKIDDMLDAFFDRSHKDHRAVQSFKECYIEITGDRKVTGRMENIDRSRFAEATGGMHFRESLDAAALANVLGNSIHRAMIRDYRLPSPEYDIWRPIVEVVPVQDFRTNERTRLGGYGDMPTVAAGAPYTALTSPSDEKATYAIGKRGGTEDITLEQIRNDDVGVITRIPVKIARASKRTLAKFVFDFIKDNPAIYDGDALYHANHGNLQTAALDATALAAHRQLMLKQTEKNSLERLGIGPKYLVVPVDLEETSVNLFNRSTNNDKTFIQTLSLTIIPVWYWTDANDWATVADPMDIPFIEIGFLDGNEEPELFVQDNPSVGSMFTHDKLTWKLRHVWGGNVVDYRGTTKAVVA